MAHQKGVEVGEVVQSGPALAFLVYPEVVLAIAPSPFWAFLFFIMLLNLGLDTQFSSVESLMTGLAQAAQATQKEVNPRYDSLHVCAGAAYDNQ